MTALPSKPSFTGSTVTQGQFKTALDNLNDYLTGLFGSDGTVATARSTLSIVNPSNPTYAQVVSALGYTPYNAASAAGKLDKSGDTMTGNLTIQNTAPTIIMQDTDNVTRQLHVNGNLMGFLKSDGNWDFYANNSGQVWSADYGWLHERFAHATPVAGQGPTGDHGVRNNCGNINCNTLVNCGYEVYNAGGGQQRLRYYIEGYNVSWNCNCDCACACACCD